MTKNNKTMKSFLMKNGCTQSVRYLLLCCIPLIVSCDRPSTESDETIGNWSTAADFKGDSRSEAAVFVIDNTAYVLTGTTEKILYNDMFAYDANNSNWTKKEALPGIPRNGAVAFSINGKGYVGTGYNRSQDDALKDFWEYDPAAKTWTQKDDLPGDPRHNAVAFVINGKAYVCGGYDGKGFNDCWQFDPTAPAGSQWKEKASFPHKTQAGVSFVLNDKGYIVTGSNNAEIQKELYQFDPVQNLWTTKRSLYNSSNESYDDQYNSIVRQNAVAFVLGKNAYIATGENGAYVTSTWGYDPDTDIWKEYTGFEAKPRDGAAAFTVGNHAFVLTGKSGSLYLDNMFEFNPNIKKVDGD
jgi:N-acetylneuraminic acid mutarotase